MFFALAAVYLYDLALEGRWRPAQNLGLAAIFLAIACSWEPLFVALGLLAASLAAGNHEQRRLAWKYAAAGVVSIALVIGFYLCQYPGQFQSLLQQVLFRVGISTRFALAVSDGEVVRPSPLQFLTTTATRAVGLLGWAPVAGVIGLAAHCAVRLRSRKLDQPSLFIAAFGTLWLGWILCFHSHYYIHSDMMTLLGLPAAAAGFGWMVSRLVSAAGKRWVHPAWVIPVLVLVCVPAALVSNVKAKPRGDILERIRMRDPSFAQNASHNPRILLAREIQRLTPPGSVVLTSEPDAVVLYYSERHLIQGLRGDRELATGLDAAVSGWPGAPVFLAVPPESRAAFERTIVSARLISENGSACIAELEPNVRHATR
jgi:hypothetical protein